MRFTNSEIGFIAKSVGKKMTVRVTDFGNVVIKHIKSTKVLFSVYKREDGFLIRRRLGYSNPFGSGNILNGGKVLPSLSVAMTYFNNYCEKYPNSIK